MLAKSGLCFMHYSRVDRHGDVGGVEPQRVKNPPLCQSPDCSMPPKCKGLCSQHYQNTAHIREYQRAYKVANASRLLVNQQTYRAANAERIAAVEKAWQVAHPEHVRAVSRAWYVANADRIAVDAKARWASDPDYRAFQSAQGKAWRGANADNKAQRVKGARAWRLANPEKLAVIKNRRRARFTKGADLTNDQWLAILAEFDGHCAYCQRTDAPLVLEHMTPLARGGRHTRNNVVPACGPCNNRKSTRTALEFAGQTGSR